MTPVLIFHIDRFSPEFIEVRRKELEKFLNRVAQHHSLHLRPEFAFFLESNEDQFNAAKSKTAKAQPGMQQSYESCSIYLTFQLQKHNLNNRAVEAVLANHFSLQLETVFPQYQISPLNQTLLARLINGSMLARITLTLSNYNFPH